MQKAKNQNPKIFQKIGLAKCISEVWKNWVEIKKQK